MKNNAPRSRTQRNEPRKAPKRAARPRRAGKTLDTWTRTVASLRGSASAGSSLTPRGKRGKTQKPYKAKRAKNMKTAGG